MTRVTQRSVSATMLTGLQSNLQRMQDLQQQLSSGKRLTRPSDDPVDTSAAMQLRAEVRRTEQHVRNADDGLAWLGTTDAVLTRSSDLAGRARTLVLSGLNATSTAESRAALAAEVRSLRAALVDAANTRYLDRPVLGGTALVGEAYAADGTYQGDGGRVSRTVAAGTSVPVSLTGPEVFGADGADDQLFAVLERLAASLESGGPTVQDDLQADLGRLDAALDRLTSALGQVGARYNRVETVRAAASDAGLSLRASLATTEDIDLAKTVVDLQMQEIAYNAALGATARVVQPSLVDFLR
jgi:flagellar hook-associated protein 3 FlgL